MKALRVFDDKGQPLYKDYDPAQPLPDGYSVLPFFPGYEYKKGVSTYWGEEVGEGGYVYSEPGMYSNVALLDIASMHPSSIIAEELFGPFTQNFADIRNARILIKHKNFDEARNMLGGKLAPYLDDESKAGDLAQALKIAINSVYGLTAANFDNPFRDIRNVDNIVAKRGALFMVNLKHAVKEKGYDVAHIKTDSIKIPNADPEIIKFVTEYGAEYGYSFEHEATYEKMCLVNDAVYIAKYMKPEKCEELYGYVMGDNAKAAKKDEKWTATGTQFQVPYVFKKLFSKESIAFEDMCETKSVSTSIYLDMNENLPDVSGAEKELAELKSFDKKFYSTYEDYSELAEDKQYKSLCKKYMRADWDLNNVWWKEIEENLEVEIEKGHDYHFVGKVGLFTPMKPGAGGGRLVRQTIDKKTNKPTGYSSVTGAKDYRWMESEMVKNLGLENQIDRSYYDNLADEAVASISQYGDFEWFAN